MTVVIKYGQFDVEAKADSTPTTSDIQSWANITDLTHDHVSPINAMTMERKRRR